MFRVSNLMLSVRAAADVVLYWLRLSPVRAEGLYLLLLCSETTSVICWFSETTSVTSMFGETASFTCLFRLAASVAVSCRGTTASVAVDDDWRIFRDTGVEQSWCFVAFRHMVKKIRLAGDERAREVQFRMMAIYPCTITQFKLFEYSISYNSYSCLEWYSD